MSDTHTEEDKTTEVELQEAFPAQPQEEEYKEKYLRLLADMENLKKRMQREKEQTLQFAIENAIGEFIPTIDNFETALKFAQNNTSPEVKNWATGFQMILTQFKDVLYTHGVVAFHSEGNQFDPHLHEAVEIVESYEYPDGIVIQEFSKGYKSPTRTLRPAQVKVAKSCKKEEEL